MGGGGGGKGAREARRRCTGDLAEPLKRLDVIHFELLD